MLPINLFNNLPGLTATLNNMAGLPTSMNMQGVPANINMPGLPTNISNTPGLTANLNNMPQMPAVLNNLPQMPQIQANLNNILQIQANLNNLLGPNMTGLNPFVWNTGNNPIQTQPVICIVAPQPAGIPVQQMPQNVPPQDISYNNSNQTEETPATVNQGFNRKRIDLDNNKFDLRHKLTRKRCLSESQDFSYCKMYTDQPIFSQERKQNFLSTNTLQEKASKFDLSLFDKLKPSDSTLLNWLIVVDAEMLLENFAFLNKLTDPGQNCYLVVPDHVMDHLEELLDEGTDIPTLMPTRRILRFLKEHIELELAFRADEVKDSTDSRYKMYATCKALAETNNVVLLSDDPGLDEYKYDHINIHVFKLQELNHFLTKFNRRRSSRASFKSPTLNIKIHVRNDKNCRGEEEGRQTSSPFIFNQVVNSGGSNIQPAIRSTTNRVPEKTNPQLPKKKQTDSSQAQDLESVENIRIHNASHEPQTSRATLLTQNSTDEVYSHTVPDKTAEPIKHERNSLSQSSANDRSRHIVRCRNRQSTTNTENNNRQSKYRRRKKTTAPKSEAPKTSEQSSQMEPPLSQEKPICEEQQHDTNVIENIPIPDISLRKNRVSSSARETVSVCDDFNFIRYQVVGQTMEEVLRTRREEWVLRFVQIMEEALRDTLRASLPSETVDNYTASWATDLPDLSRCIIKKFTVHHHVVDAANRLAYTLDRISDKKGNVCASIKPRQYMDMYSYGLYLIESLKQVIENCDDLTASAESLKKLMFDIQNAKQECDHNDTFMDKLAIDEYIDTRTDVNTPRSPSSKTPASPKITPNVKAGQATTASNVTEDSKKSEDDKSNKDAKETPVPTNRNTSQIKIVTKIDNIPQLEEKLDKIQNDKYSIDNVNITDCIKEIMRPCDLVKKLCSKMLDDLKNSRKPSLEMQRKLESAYSLMIKLENTLLRILDRENTTASLHSYVPDKDLYKRTIRGCLKKVSNYHQIVTRLMAVCKQQVT